MTPPVDVEIPDNNAVDNTGIDQIKEDISLLKKDFQALDVKIADFEKNKDKLNKEEVDKLKKEIEEESKRVEAKKQELLTLLRQTKSELVDLKGDIDVSTEKSELEGLEKELNELKLKALSKKEGGFWEKTKEFGSKVLESAKEHPILAATVVGLAIWGISRLFRKKKNKKENGEGEKESFWSHGIGKVLKWGLIGTGLRYVGRGIFTGRWDLFGLGKTETTPNDPGLNILTDPQKIDESFDKLPENVQQQYNEIGSSANDFYKNVYGGDLEMGGSTLGQGESGEGYEKEAGAVPFLLDDMYGTTGDILSESSFFGEKRLKKKLALKEYLGKLTDKALSLVLSPFRKMFSWFTSDMEDENGNLNDKGIEALNKSENKESSMDAYLMLVERKFMKTRTFLEDKENQLRFILTKKALEAKGETDIDDDDVEAMMDDSDFQKEHVDKDMDSLFYKRRIVSKEGNPSVYDTLKDYNILNGNISQEIKDIVENIDERKESVLGNVFEDIENQDDSQISGSMLEDVGEVVSDFEREINSDFIKQGFVTRNLGIFKSMFNLEDVSQEELSRLVGYDAVAAMYIEGLMPYKDKIAKKTLTKQDVIQMKKLMDQFFMFEKEIMTGVGMMVDVKEKNGDITVKLANTAGNFYEWLIHPTTTGGWVVRGLMVGCVLPFWPGRLVRNLTTHVVLRPSWLLANWGLGKLGYLTRLTGRRLGLPIIMSKYLYVGNGAPTKLLKDVQRGWITLDQAAKIVDSKTNGFFVSSTVKNQWIKEFGVIAKGNVDDVKRQLIRKTFPSVSEDDAHLIAKYYDKGWHKYLRAGSLDTTKIDTLKQFDKHMTAFDKLAKADRSQIKVSLGVNRYANGINNGNGLPTKYKVGNDEFDIPETLKKQFDVSYEEVLKWTDDAKRVKALDELDKELSDILVNSASKKKDFLELHIKNASFADVNDIDNIVKEIDNIDFQYLDVKRIRKFKKLDEVKNLATNLRKIGNHVVNDLGILEKSGGSDALTLLQIDRLKILKTKIPLFTEDQINLFKYFSDNNIEARNFVKIMDWLDNPTVGKQLKKALLGGRLDEFVVVLRSNKNVLGASDDLIKGFEDLFEVFKKLDSKTVSKMIKTLVKTFARLT